MKFLITFLLSIFSLPVFSQVMYVAKDSISLSRKCGYSPTAYIYYGDTVKILKRTKKQAIDTSGSYMNRMDRFSTWTRIQTQGRRLGWVVHNQLKKRLIPPPAKIIGLNQGDVYQDEIYPIGWSKNAFAYMIEGYIDGAVDGLTVRHYVRNFSGKYTDSLVDYTSYIDPIDAMWKQQSFAIQNSLERNKIVPLTTSVEAKTLPVMANKTDTVHLYWDMSKYPVIIQASIGGVEKDVLTVKSSVSRITILGWLVNPLDKNKLVVIVAFITESTAHYVDVVMVDVKRFKKK